MISIWISKPQTSVIIPFRSFANQSTVYHFLQWGSHKGNLRICLYSHAKGIFSLRGLRDRSWSAPRQQRGEWEHLRIIRHTEHKTDATIGAIPTTSLHCWSHVIYSQKIFGGKNEEKCFSYLFLPLNYLVYFIDIVKIC